MAFILSRSDDASSIQYQNRSKLLSSKDDVFFGWQRVLESQQPALMRLHASLFDKDDTCALVHVFHELYGGQYKSNTLGGIFNANGKQYNVTAEKAYCVQRRVWYAPDNHAAVFAIRIEDAAKSVKWLAWDQVVRLCAAAGLATVPEIGRCTLRELLTAKQYEHAQEFETLVPQRLHRLPQLSAPNPAEGLVVRWIVTNGTMGRMLKWKHPQFEEIVQKQRLGARDKQQAEQVNRNQSKSNLIHLVNENRIDAYISKHGPQALHKLSTTEHVRAIAQDTLADHPEETVSLDDFIDMARHRIQGLFHRRMSCFPLDSHET